MRRLFLFIPADGVTGLADISHKDRFSRPLWIAHRSEKKQNISCSTRRVSRSHDPTLRREYKRRHGNWRSVFPWTARPLSGSVKNDSPFHCGTAATNKARRTACPTRELCYHRDWNGARNGSSTRGQLTTARRVRGIIGATRLPRVVGASRREDSLLTSGDTYAPRSRPFPVTVASYGTNGAHSMLRLSCVRG